MCIEGMVTPRQRRWRIGRAFCQRASPSPFSLEDPADTADSYACWTDENADEAAVGWTERVRHNQPFANGPRLGRIEPNEWTISLVGRGAGHSAATAQNPVPSCGARLWMSAGGFAV